MSKARREPKKRTGTTRTGVKTKVQRGTAVLVLGAPRSGTSAVSQLLSDMGVYFGEPTDFVDATVHTHNPVFFELQSLNDLNDEILSSVGIEYGHFEYFPLSTELNLPADKLPKLEEKARAVIKQLLKNAPLIGMKDPRFVYTLAFWERALNHEGYETKLIRTHRATEEAIVSNAKVNSGSTKYNSRVVFVSDGLAALQVRGKDSFLLHYSELLSSPSSVAQKIAAWMDHPSCKVPTEFGVHSELQHERSPSAIDAPVTVEEYLDWVESLKRYGILELLGAQREENQKLWETTAELGRYNDELTALWESRNKDAQEQGQAALNVADTLDRLNSATEAIEAMVTSTSAQLVERLTQRNTGLESAIFSLNAQLEENVEALGKARIEIDEVESVRMEREAQFESTIQALQQDHDSTLASIHAERDETIGAIKNRHDSTVASLTQELTDRSAKLEGLQGELSEKTASLSKAQADLSALSFAADETNAKLQAADAHVAQMSAALTLIESKLTSLQKDHAEANQLLGEHRQMLLESTKRAHQFEQKVAQYEAAIVSYREKIAQLESTNELQKLDLAQLDSASRAEINRLTRLESDHVEKLKQLHERIGKIESEFEFAVDAGAKEQARLKQQVEMHQSRERDLEQMLASMAKRLQEDLQRRDIESNRLVKLGDENRALAEAKLQLQDRIDALIAEQGELAHRSSTQVKELTTELDLIRNRRWFQIKRT